MITKNPRCALAISIFLTGNMKDVCLMNLQSSPKILETPMHDPLHLQQHCQREGGGGGTEREQNFPKCFKVFV